MSLQPCRSAPALTLVNETAAHGPEIEALLNRAFGPGRFAKSSERVREFAEFAAELSFCAVEAGKVVGAVRMWRVNVGGQPIMFLGPLAVEEGERSYGLGAQLVARACEASEAAGEAAVVLVGDMAYFGRLGFGVAPGVRIPGPVDPERVLSRLSRHVALSGMIQPR